MRIPPMVVERWKLTIALLTDRRALTLVFVDVLFALFAILVALLGDGTVNGMYRALFLVPILLFGVPILSESVALERRAGTLDLALSSPGARFYFERRVLSVAVLMLAHGALAIAVARFGIAWFPLSGAIVQIAVVTLFVCSVTLFWCVRLRTSGSVIFATYVTVAAFFPWFSPSAFHAISHCNSLMQPHEIVDWFKRNIVLGCAAAIFYLYTLQRVSRPEAILE